MHYRYHSTKLQVFQEYLAPWPVLVLIQANPKKNSSVRGVAMGRALVLIQVGVAASPEGLFHFACGEINGNAAGVASKLLRVTSGSAKKQKTTRMGGFLFFGGPSRARQRSPVANSGTRCLVGTAHHLQAKRQRSWGRSAAKVLALCQKKKHRTRRCFSLLVETEGLEPSTSRM